MGTSQARAPEIMIVGAGFAGMYLVHKLRALGFAVQAVDMAPEVGGTWFHNRYPGLRCDVESLQYQYSWSEDLRNGWTWSERYPPQPEILAYAKWVADTLDLRRDILLNTKVTGTRWDETAGHWVVEVEGGATYTPRFLIMATGALSVPRFPNIPGIGRFKGTLVHTADWPQDGVDLSGKRVGLIGTGSSGVQVATAIAPQVAHLALFQRTPAYTIPARNRALTDADRADFQTRFKTYDAMMRKTSGGILNDPPNVSALDVAPDVRQDMLQAAWQKGGSFAFTAIFNDVRKNTEANKIVADFVRDRIREAVDDPDTAECLCPTDFIAARRVCVDTGYYQIFNRENVDLIDVAADPIAEITETGLQLASGATHDCDVLIAATGYDAITGAQLALDVRGTDGQTIQTAWAEGPRTYLGLGVAGFPNMFTVTGPGSPAVLSNVLRSIEHHVDWIAGCLVHLRDQPANRIEVEPEAQNRWVQHVNDVADQTLFTKTACWYMGADIPGKPRVFMPYAGGLPRYMETCEKVAQEGYAGFAIT